MFIDQELLRKLASVASSQERVTKRRRDQREVERHRRALNTLFVAQSLEFAERTVPFYRRRADKSGIKASSFLSLRDLTNYASVSRFDILANPDSFISQEVSADMVRSTSGTTTGQPMMIYGNRSEAAAQRALVDLHSNSHATGELILRITPPVRRLSSPATVAENTVELHLAYIPEPMPNSWLDHTDFLAQILDKKYSLHGRLVTISIIHITPPYFFPMMTRTLKQKGYSPSDFGVSRILLSGGDVTPQMREIARTDWRAACTSSFSCSEINGAAIDASDTPSVYRPFPTLYCEVADPETGRPLSDGRAGLLRMTSFFPFQQVMPLIRYAPGDIVRVVDDGKAAVPGFQPVGRLDHCIKLGESNYIGPSDILSILEDFPEIPQVPYPRFRITSQPRGKRMLLTLQVEIQNQRLTRLPAGKQIERRLERLLSQLLRKQKTHAVDVTVELHAKGSLREFFRLYPA